MKPNQYELDEWNLLVETTLLDVCASLVIINKNTKTVRLVQEYLFRNCMPLDAGFRAAMSCLTYLSFDIFAQDVPKNSPATLSQLHLLLSYAANQLSSHLKACDGASAMSVLVSFLGN